MRELRIVFALLMGQACGSSKSAEPGIRDAADAAANGEGSVGGNGLDSGAGDEALADAADPSDAGAQEDGGGGSDSGPTEETGFFGVNTNPQQELGNPNGAVLREAGAEWVRVEVRDQCTADVDPQNLDLYDRVVEDLGASGIRVLLLLDYATTAGVPFGARDEGPWDAYAPVLARCASLVAAHYASPPFEPADVDAYEIWNEPDNPPGNPSYDPYVPPAAFGRMFAMTAQAIRDAVRAAAGPQAVLPTIVTGGVDSGPYSGYLEEALPQMATAEPDAVGVHSYGERPDPDWPDPQWGFAYLGDNARAFHAIAGRPLWMTEFGTEDLGIQADYMTRMFARLRGELGDVVQTAFVYSWSDAMGGQWGLTDVWGNPKDSYCAFRQASFGLASCDDPAP